MTATKTKKKKTSKKPITKREALIGQEELIECIDRVLTIFQSSEGTIRPHFFLTGPSGSTKTMAVEALTADKNLPMITINAAQITKEGTSGNSISKSLSVLQKTGDKPTVVFVDEFDKLFISSDANGVAHEITTGVQNEFLKILESETTETLAEYATYVRTRVDKCLFIFAGAFNNADKIDLDDLRKLGVKTEFLGRVGVIFNSRHLTLEELHKVVDQNSTLKKYFELFPTEKQKPILSIIKEYITANYELNTIGARIVDTLANQYFIYKGDLPLFEKAVKSSTFQKQLTMEGDVIAEPTKKKKKKSKKKKK